MALSLVAAVALSAATSDLRAARRALAQLEVEARLETAHSLAAATVTNDVGSGPLAWTLPVDDQPALILAEPEAAKRSWAEASETALALEPLRPAAAAQARAALARLAATPEAPAGAVTGLDVSPRWRACAASVLSPHGTGDGALLAPRAPKAGRGSARLGQVWRIRATYAGWTETRYLRFTGEADRPWAVLERTLAATPDGNAPCLP